MITIISAFLLTLFIPTAYSAAQPPDDVRIRYADNVYSPYWELTIIAPRGSLVYVKTKVPYENPNTCMVYEQCIFRFKTSDEIIKQYANRVGAEEYIDPIIISIRLPDGNLYTKHLSIKFHLMKELTNAQWSEPKISIRDDYYYITGTVTVPFSFVYLYDDKGQNIVTVPVENRHYTIRFPQFLIDKPTVYTLKIATYDGYAQSPHIPIILGEWQYKENIVFSIDSPYIKANDKTLITDAPPIIGPGNRSYLPIRMFEQLFNIKLTWDPYTKIVILTQCDSHGKTQIILNFAHGQYQEWSGKRIYLGNPKVTVIQYGQIYYKDLSRDGYGYPIIYKGRTMLPVRYIAELFGYRVFWLPLVKIVWLAK
jgi:hypothetical protein